MWALPEIVVLMAIVWNVWVKNMIAIFRTALNRESSALLNMSDMGRHLLRGCLSVHLSVTLVSHAHAYTVQNIEIRIAP